MIFTKQTRTKRINQANYISVSWIPLTKRLIEVYNPNQLKRMTALYHTVLDPYINAFIKTFNTNNI